MTNAPHSPRDEESLAVGELRIDFLSARHVSPAPTQG